MPEQPPVKPCVLNLPSYDIDGGPGKENCLICIIGAFDEARAAIATTLHGATMTLGRGQQVLLLIETQMKLAALIFPKWAEMYDPVINKRFGEAVENAKAMMRAYVEQQRKLLSGEAANAYRT